jgi:heat shock protein HslJ
MKVVRISLLVMVTAVFGIVRADTTQAAPQPRIASGIPPYVWSLTSFPGVGAIAEPGRYTVQFLPDGTVGVGADCNRAAGVWTGSDGAIDITVTLSTLALCPEGSLGDPFVQALDAVTGYTLAGGSLTLHGAAGDLTFTA